MILGREPQEGGWGCLKGFGVPCGRTSPAPELSCAWQGPSPHAGLCSASLPAQLPSTAYTTGYLVGFLITSFSSFAAQRDTELHLNGFLSTAHLKEENCLQPQALARHSLYLWIQNQHSTSQGAAWLCSPCRSSQSRLRNTSPSMSRIYLPVPLPSPTSSISCSGPRPAARLEQEPRRAPGCLCWLQGHHPLLFAA